MKYDHVKRLGDDAIYAALKRHDFSRALTAQELRASVDTIRHHVRRLKNIGYKIPGDPNNVNAGKAAEYLPTPDEIKYHCRQFQEHWTEAEELYRRRGRTHGDGGYEFPRVGDLIYG